MKQQYVSPEETRKAWESGVSEKVFMQQVIQLARLNQWMCYHTHDSRRSEPGYPDLTLCRPATQTAPARLIYAELKAEKGRLTKEQEAWLLALRQTPAEVYVWKPSCWAEIEQVLG